MLKIKIPLIDKGLELYEGEEELKKWKASCIKQGCPDPMIHSMEADPTGGGGLTWGGFIWVSDKKDPNTVFHEVQHALNNVMDVVFSHEHEEEFSAYIAGYVSEKVFNWMLD